MKALLFFIILGLSLPLEAQFLRLDFADADLSDWQGNTDKFSVIDGQLRLSDPAPGSSNRSFLSRPAATSTEELTTWECWIRLDFAPSGSNFARLYLSASRPQLDDPLEGYFLQVGGISGDQDAVELYRQDGTAEERLITGTPGAVGQDPAVVRIQVTRSAAGQWRLLTDYTGGENFQLEGEAGDLTYPVGRFFGLLCIYSSTRGDAFFFDDILIDPLFEDQTPPRLVSATAVDQNTLNVQFDEFLDPGPAGDMNNYSLSDGFGNPVTATPSAADPSVVTLEWDQAFVPFTVYTLTVSAIADEQGNIAGIQNAEFTYIPVGRPRPGDLLVSEFMADPAPPRGLPNAEYVELYNPTAKVLELEGVGISTGGTPRLLPPFELFPDSYLILCDEDDLPAFSAYGLALGVDGLPALTNGGDELLLTAADGTELVSIRYDLDWYRDPEKIEGGWSLELITSAAPVDCPGNWIASVDNQGGTPGRQNSVQGMSLDTEGPTLLSAYVQGDAEVFLRFDEVLDPAAAEDPAAYTIAGGPDVEAAVLLPDGREVSLLLEAPLQTGLAYEVTAGFGISDCLGNPIATPVSRRVGIAEPAAPGDLVINEILFLPEVRGEDFLELYNRSDKIINLRDWSVSNRQPDGSDRSTRVTQDFLIFPAEYAVITADPQDILNRYTVNFPERMLANGLPTMGEEGQLTVRNAAFVTIDSFAYSSDLHSPLLADERGVSLERIAPEAPTNSPGNWHSAAGTVGFATPTDRNSQFSPQQPPAAQMVTLPNPRFSPDGDGFEDVLLIEVAADRPGYLATIQIFDANGRLIRRLLRNELLPVRTVYLWDGTDAEGQKARIGVYVIWIELVHPDGTVERRQEACVLAGALGE